MCRLRGSKETRHFGVPEEIIYSHFHIYYLSQTTQIYLLYLLHDSHTWFQFICVNMMTY